MSSSRSLFDRKRDAIEYKDAETCLDILMSQHTNKGIIRSNSSLSNLSSSTNSGRNSPTLDMQYRKIIEKLIDAHEFSVNIDKIVSILLKTEKHKIDFEYVNSLIEMHKKL